MTVPASSPSERAAAQVEQIVAAAQEAAEKIRGEAAAARREARLEGERDAEAMLHEARKQAILLTQDARRDAEGIISDAREEAARIREQTKRAVDGRVAAAEKAAAEVLAEARALSGGLQQLGHSLQDRAERILREIEMAHKRMQADLRVGSDDSERAKEAPPPKDAEEPVSARPNPLRELEVPNWVTPD